VAIFTNACESLASGSVTVGNSDDDGVSNPFTLTSGMTYQTAVKQQGTGAITAINPGGVAFSAYTSTAKQFSRHYEQFSTVPPSGFEFVRISYTADTLAAVLRLGASGSVVLITKGNVTRETSPTGIVTAGTFLRFELFVDPGTTASNGSARAAVYAGDSTTALWTSADYTGIDTAGTSGVLNYAIVGKYSGTAWTGQFYVDDIGLKTATDAVWAPWPSSSTIAYTATITDPVGVTDFSGDQTLQIGLDLADPVGITDARAQARSATTPQADGVGVTDSVSVAMSRAVTISDGVGVSDASNASFAGNVTASVNDGVGVTDTRTVAWTRSRAVGSDAVGVTDSVSAILTQPVGLPVYLGDVAVTLAIGDVPIHLG